jgi:hypothetical protein
MRLISQGLVLVAVFLTATSTYSQTFSSPGGSGTLNPDGSFSGSFSVVGQSGPASGSYSGNVAQGGGIAGRFSGTAGSGSIRGSLDLPTGNFSVRWSGPSVVSGSYSGNVPLPPPPPPSVPPAPIAHTDMWEQPDIKFIDEFTAGEMSRESREEFRQRIRDAVRENYRGTPSPTVQPGGGGGRRG